MVCVEFNYYIEHKTILARVIDSRHPEMQVSPHFWRRFSGAELWGFLRHWPIDRVLVGLDMNPLHLVILMADDEESTAYVKISAEEYDRFIEFYGASILNEEGQPAHNWLREGF